VDGCKRQIGLHVVRARTVRVEGFPTAVQGTALKAGGEAAALAVPNCTCATSHLANG
jgi:hypothetical protein